MDLWTTLDRIGIVLGIVAFFPIAWAVVLYWRRNVRLKKSINNAIARASTHQPIYIELTGKNSVIETAENYLRKEDLTGEILPFIQLYKKGVNLNNFNEVEKLKNELVNLKLEAMAKAPECIHLFYSGPVAVAIVLGDIFSNCKNVHIYHKLDESYQHVSKI